MTRFVDIEELQPKSTVLTSQSRCRRNKANVGDNKLGGQSVRKRSVVSAAGQKHSNDESCNNTQDKRTKGDFTGETASEKGDANLVNNLLSPFSLCEKKERAFTGRGIMMSKRVKHFRIYGAIKAKKSVCVRWGCAEGHATGPDTAFC